MLNVTQIHKGVHRADFTRKSYSDELTILNISDVHFDSIKCDRELLHKHLTEAERLGAFVLINGDWFDLMQGRYDPRGGKFEIRPEYKYANYLDMVINDSADYLSKFNLQYFIGQGNHETNITKRLETNPSERLVERLRFMGKNAHLGSYSGLIVFSLIGNGKSTSVTRLHYHHGAGGNAPRSKGIMSTDIDQMQHPDADILTKGHDHNKWYLPVSVDRYRSDYKPIQSTVHHIRSGSYKIKDRLLGWEVEKGFRTPRLGGWWIGIKAVRKTEDGLRKLSNEVRVWEAY
jgi:UDP-2,3-diacylglucosamine pyrophosphatase LpxH